MTEVFEGFEDPRRVLARHGLSPKRGMSQNFLCAPHAVTRIATATGAGAGDTVVELGPGCGTLTAALLARGARVLAIERDPDMLRVLAAEFGDADLVVRAGDATQVDYRALAAELGAAPRVAGNLPYAVTGAIMRRLTEQAAHIASAVIMVQKEVGQRLMADPGDGQYGALSVFAQNVFEPQLCLKVPATAFHPKPKVDSVVVKLTPRAVPQARAPRFAAVVRAAFQARRKTLRNALRQLPGVDAETALQCLQGAELPEDIRGERLSVAAFDRLAQQLGDRLDALAP